eukprot:2926934-Amphidinium_carterae.1
MDTVAPMNLQACRLSSDDLECLQAFWEGQNITKKQVLKLREQSLVCPPPMDVQAFRDISAQRCLLPDPSIEVHDWVKDLCRRRDGCSDALILAELP